MTSLKESNDSIKNVSIKDTVVMSVEERLEDVSVLRDMFENLKKVVDYVPYQSGEGYKCVPKDWEEVKDVLINDEKVKEAIYLAVVLSAKTNKNKKVVKRDSYYLIPTALLEIGKRVESALTKKENELKKAQEPVKSSGKSSNLSLKSGKSEFELLIANDVYINSRKAKLSLGIGNTEQLNTEIEARIDELTAKYMAEHKEA